MIGAPRNPKNTNMSPLASNNCTAPVETKICHSERLRCPVRLTGWATTSGWAGPASSSER